MGKYGDGLALCQSEGLSSLCLPSCLSLFCPRSFTFSFSSSRSKSSNSRSSSSSIGSNKSSSSRSSSISSSKSSSSRSSTSSSSKSSSSRSRRKVRRIEPTDWADNLSKYGDGLALCQSEGLSSLCLPSCLSLFCPRSFTCPFLFFCFAERQADAGADAGSWDPGSRTPITRAWSCSSSPTAPRAQGRWSTTPPPSTGESQTWVCSCVFLSSHLHRRCYLLLLKFSPTSGVLSYYLAGPV